MKKTQTLAFIIFLLFHLSILFYFHDRFWCAADEGLFAHTAERMLDGERLYIDVEEAHPGYIHWINAFALKLWGRDLVSLRYPLAGIAIVQSCLIFLLLRKNILTAFLAGLSPTLLGILHFLNPNHHWYAMFFTIVLGWYLVNSRATSARRYVIAGILVATVYMFRQLTGVFTGMAVLSYLLFEASLPRAGHARRIYHSDIILAGMLTAVSVYLLKKADLLSFILFGMPPVFLLIWLLRSRCVDNRKTAEVLKFLFLGVLAGFAPIVLNQMLQGSLPQWFENTVIRAARVYGQAFLSQQNYSLMLTMAVQGIFQPSGFGNFINGFYFLILMFLSAGNGLLGIWALERSKNIEAKEFALFFLAVFYGLVSLHFQIPVYLYFSAGLTAVGILSLLMIKVVPGRVQRVVRCSLVFLFSVGICCQAAQPLIRPMDWILRGDTLPFQFAGNRIARVSLWIDPVSLSEYENISTVIGQRTKKGEAILVLPYNPEIYFITQRRNILSFPILDYQNQADYARIVAEVKAVLPSLIVYSPFDKRVTPLTTRIMEELRGNYRMIQKTIEWEVYERIK